MLREAARDGVHEIARAILFDLDDTILVAFGPAQSQWQRTIAAFADQLGPNEATVIAAAIEAVSTKLWAGSLTDTRAANEREPRFFGHNIYC